MSQIGTPFMKMLIFYTVNALNFSSQMPQKRISTFEAVPELVRGFLNPIEVLGEAVEIA